MFLVRFRHALKVAAQLTAPELPVEPEGHTSLALIKQTQHNVSRTCRGRFSMKHFIEGIIGLLEWVSLP